VRDFWQSLQVPDAHKGRSPHGSSLWPGALMGGRWDQSSPQDILEETNITYASHMALFKPGTLKPFGQPYSKMIVVPHMLKEDVSWITDIFTPGGDINSAIYVVDDLNAPLHPPENKGHEVMVYLTYIIDNYDNLADVNIFMHAHRMAWHNDELLDFDAVQMISRLSSERVQREGYMNLRCSWQPGCPNWMHPGSTGVNVNKQEQTALAGSWSELFPADPIPETLAQPCCAQFAVSRDRIQSLPRSQYIFYREWLLKTSLSDYISGRIWEYVWHYLFTGKNVHCPKEHICYCDGFGICFGGEDKYDEWWDTMWQKRMQEDLLKEWHDKDDKAKQAQVVGDTTNKAQQEQAEPGKDKELSDEIAKQDQWLKTELQRAKERGNSPENRALEAGT
jgi:hypothetical protein